MPRKRRRFFLIPFFVIGVLCLLGAIVMQLWNAILPDLLNVCRISYGQSLGLLILCRILFGSFRPGRPGGFRRGGGGPPWKTKLMDLTPEEREQFKRQWDQRCGPDKD